MLNTFDVRFGLHVVMFRFEKNKYGIFELRQQ